MSGPNESPTQSQTPPTTEEPAKSGPISPRLTPLLELWEATGTTQQHFNSLQLQLRNFGLTLFLAVLTGAGYAVKEQVRIDALPSVPFAAVVCLIGFIIAFGFFLMDWGYHQLLNGAVAQGIKIEKSLTSAGLPEASLASAIKEESSKRKFLWLFTTNSTFRLNMFYFTQLGVMAVAGGVAFFVSAGASKSQAAAEQKPSVAQTPSVVVPPAKSAAVPNDPSAGQRALKKFYSSGAYAQVVDHVVRLAEAFVDQHESSGRTEKVVAVFDVDETALSTWEILNSGDFTWDQNRFEQFIRDGKCTKIGPVHRLFEKLKNKGIPVVFITGRGGHLKEATEKNLVAQGFEGYADLIMRPAGASSTKAFKTQARQSLADRGLKIFLAVGDQLDDLDPQLASGGNFLIPNPFY